MLGGLDLISLICIVGFSDKLGVGTEGLRLSNITWNSW